MLCLNPAGGDVSFQPYHDYNAMTSKLRQLNDAHPDLSYLYKLSATSVEGRQLWVLQLGSSAGTERGQLVPMVKFVANMHGNEVIGRELMLTLAEYLLEEYKVCASLLRIRFNMMDFLFKLNTGKKSTNRETVGHDGYPRDAQHEPGRFRAGHQGHLSRLLA